MSYQLNVNQSQLKISTMTTLIELLKKETESLKIQYIEMTSEWASKEFDRLRNWANRYNMGEFGYGEASKKYYRLPYDVVNSNGKKENFVEREVKNAEEHYEASIEKLAFRIEKKGLNQNNLKLGTSHIGVNIETTITDGNKKVSAWTIIASGAIQRPHYRYLIK